MVGIQDCMDDEEENLCGEGSEKRRLKGFTADPGPACGDDKKAIDDYTSEIGMGGRNTPAIYSTVRLSLCLYLSPHWA